ncbi:MAG: hypothetical protein ACOCQG_01225 [Candidatus Nanoarchaeia archaeon]
MDIMREVSFSLIQFKAEEIFSITKKYIDIPEYAPINESLKCSKCGESTMSTRLMQGFCYECFGQTYMELNGHDIEK